MVPREQVYDARIQLSGEGLPSQGADGYALLDDQSLSTSQFQEQTSYKRAIEGELEKTIEALDVVQSAVVHVAMPQEELFESDTKPTTASVKACGCSTLEMCAASRIVMLAAGMRLRMNSPAAMGVDMSWRPAITSVGLLIFGSSSRWSSVESASQQAR